MWMDFSPFCSVPHSLQKGCLLSSVCAKPKHGYAYVSHSSEMTSRNSCNSILDAQGPLPPSHNTACMHPPETAYKPNPGGWAGGQLWSPPSPLKFICFQTLAPAAPGDVRPLTRPNPKAFSLPTTVGDPRRWSGARCLRPPRDPLAAVKRSPGTPHAVARLVAAFCIGGQRENLETLGICANICAKYVQYALFWPKRCNTR